QGQGSRRQERSEPGGRRVPPTQRSRQPGERTTRSRVRGGTRRRFHGAEYGSSDPVFGRASDVAYVRQDQCPSRRRRVVSLARLVGAADPLPDSPPAATVSAARSPADVCHTADPSGRATCTVTSGAWYVPGPR